MDQASILIVSDDAELSRAVTGRWQSERTVPAFTLMSSDVCLGLDPDTFHLALLDSQGEAMADKTVHVPRGKSLRTSLLGCRNYYIHLEVCVCGTLTPELAEEGGCNG